MIDLILKMLDIDDYYGVSDNIDIAKGKYKLQTTFRGAKKQHKRRKAWQ